MTRDVITTRPSATLRSALSTMHSRGIRRLPVVSGDGRLEGLIAFDDILEVTSEELDELVGLVAREQKLERCSERASRLVSRRRGTGMQMDCSITWRRHLSAHTLMRCASGMPHERLRRVLLIPRATARTF